MDFFGGFFWDRLNTHQCSYVTRTDRRVEGWLQNGWRIHGGFMADSWRIHGGFMADSWRIHGGFMADSWQMGLQKLTTVLDMRNGYKGGV
jgi:hypothetical protein